MVGTILYYVRAIDMTLLPALSFLPSKQAKSTKHMVENTEQMLDYLVTNPDKKLGLCY